MTPRQVFLTLSAHRARQEKAWERAVLLARLTALAVHDPAHLPDLPKAPLPDMTADEMKRRLLSGVRKDDLL